MKQLMLKIKELHSEMLQLAEKGVDRLDEKRGEIAKILSRPDSNVDIDIYPRMRVVVVLLMDDDQHVTHTARYIMTSQKFVKDVGDINCPELDEFMLTFLNNGDPQ